MKVTRRRKGCMGTCMTLRASVFQRRIIVPWMREWMHRRRERRRKAEVESVASVKGRYMRI